MGLTESRPVHELTAADFQRHPIREFRVDAEGADDTDESHASPAPAGLCHGDCGSFMVQATILLKNGQELPGAVQVDLLGSKELFTPAFVYVQGERLDPLSTDAAIRIERITKLSDARPASWRLSVPFVGDAEKRAGKIAQSRLVQALQLLVRLASLRFIRRGE